MVVITEAKTKTVGDVKLQCWWSVFWLIIIDQVGDEASESKGILSTK